jgi:hypothetical protein
MFPNTIGPMDIPGTKKYAEKFSESHTHGSDGPGLDHEEKCPAIKEPP